MRKLILLLSFTFFFAGTALGADTVSSVDTLKNELVVKYNKEKAKQYLQKLIEERESLENNRDFREMIRNRESSKIYCKVDFKAGCKTH